MSGGSTHTPGRCLYECLGVARNVSESELKKAYRKAALVHHPDRNVGNEEAAKIAFQEITHAYTVLSDKNERQWYDDHRTEILCGDKGGGGGGGEEEASRVPDLWTYFRADAFTGFNDDKNSFYVVYARAFQEIFEAEAEQRREGTADAPPEAEDAPAFGGSGAPYADVARFYGYWAHFATRLGFTWEDEYNPNDVSYIGYPI
ncbi:unnamed protein product [Phaeothamnion confervicola]